MKRTLIRLLAYLLKIDFPYANYRVNWFHLHQVSEHNRHPAEGAPSVYVRTHTE